MLECCSTVTLLSLTSSFRTAGFIELQSILDVCKEIYNSISFPDAYFCRQNTLSMAACLLNQYKVIVMVTSLFAHTSSFKEHVLFS